jgi:hypothetical protein
MANIWSDNYLNQLLIDAGADINNQVKALFHRFYLTTTSGTSVYTLPDKVKGIKRITWRGKELEPASWTDLLALAPGLSFVDAGDRVEGTSSVPLYYALHPTNIHDIKFYPCPNESLSATGGDPYKPTPNEERCTITCWRSSDTTDSLASLPNYIDRRTRKAYVLSQAFAKEGKGQDSKAAQYYLTKYNFLVQKFQQINSGCYTCIRYQLDDKLSNYGRKPAKPVLPPQFENIVY